MYKQRKKAKIFILYKAVTQYQNCFKRIKKMKAITKALNAKVRVRNMQSANGTTVANQFIINTEYGIMFRSYDSNIAFKPNDESTIYLGEDWDYSTTTGKYRNQFLNCNTAEVRAMIKSGKAVLVKAL